MTDTTTDAAEARVNLAERIRAAVTYQYMPMQVRKLLSEAAQALATAEAASGAGEREASDPASVRYLIASARGHLANVRAHGNAEANACVVIERALTAALASLPPATDPAMVTVPREPTEAMMAAWESACPAMGWDALQDMSDEDANRALVRAEWSAMLAAAPTIPATGHAATEGEGA